MIWILLIAVLLVGLVVAMGLMLWTFVALERIWLAQDRIDREGRL